MTFLSHLPALLVVVPMAVAPLIAVLPSRSRLGYALATLTAGLTFVIAVLLANHVASQGSMAYEMGSWPVPFGIGALGDTLLGRHGADHFGGFLCRPFVGSQKPRE